MPNALEHVTWGACVLEPRRDLELEAYARRKVGMAYPALRYYTPVPWLARALVDLHPEYGLLMQLDQQVADLVALVVSQENSCRFCYAAARAFLWGQGMSRERIQRVEHDLARADLPPRTLAALAFARSQSRAGPPAARAARDALTRAGFGSEEMRELAFVVATLDTMNRVHTIPAIPVGSIERYPEQFHMRLIWPIVCRVMQRWHSRGRPTPLGDVPTHPYARHVSAFSGSPIAGALNEMLEGMWASPHLTKRCKLLMLAVVARGLACDVCSRDVNEAACREGIGEAHLTQVLDHLDAPVLDPLERKLVAFARDTIWFEPATIQQRARALKNELSSEQLIEAIGVASVANALCRMGAVLHSP